MAGDTSRANGARSRGPRTPQGKARSSRNSARHGLRGTLPSERQVEALRVAQALIRSLGLDAAVPDAHNLTLRAACLTFAEEDQRIQQILALKEVLAAGTRAALEAERLLARSWHETRVAISDHNARHPGSVHVQFDIIPVIREGSFDLLAEASRGARRAKGGQPPLAPFLGPDLVYPGDPSGDLHALALFLDDTARTTATLDGYLSRAISRRRKACKVLASLGAAAFDTAAFSIQRPSRSAAGLDALLRKAHQRDGAGEGAADRRRRAGPTLNALGQLHDHDAGLQLAVFWRYADLGEPIHRVLIAAMQALQLGHLALSRRFCDRARRLQRRREAFLAAASEATRFEGLEKVLDAYRNRSRVEQIRAETMAIVLSMIRREPGGRDTGPEADQTQIGTNEPDAGEADGRIGLLSPGTGSPVSNHRACAAADPDAGQARETSRTRNGTNEPGVSHASAPAAPPSAAPRTTDTAAAARPMAPPVTPQPSGPSAPTSNSASTPLPQPTSNPVTPAPAPKKRHPLDGIVPREYQGRGTLAEPLFNPPPGPFVGAPQWIVPSTRADPVTRRVLQNQPPPQRRQTGPVSPWEPGPIDANDPDYEWVPRDPTGDRLGMIQVRRKKPP